MSLRPRPLLVPLLASLLAAPVVARAHSYEDEPIHYSSAAPHDPVARLAERIARGEVTLAWSEPFGYLPALLGALQVPVSSQTLVFSKTSLQLDRIAPRTPRALYFNDEVYVGYVPDGEVLEVAAVDPLLGTVFYVVPQKAPAGDRAAPARKTHECLQCHDSQGFTGGVPGLMMRSVYVDPSGHPMLTAGTFVTDQRSPLEERFGGWYVTGTHGKARHMGNLVVREGEMIDRERGANLTSLARRIDEGAYLGKGSDLVALMVLTHQAQMHNLITKAAFEAQLALQDDAVMNEALGRPKSYRSETTTSRLRGVGEPLVQHLLFSGEAPLAAPLAGTSPFAKEFAARGPRDRRGRSLRDLDLKRRLLRHPCSYLIYGEAFARLPPVIKEYVYGRLWDVLSGKDESAPFAHLSREDRTALLEILRDTLPDLPASWRRAAPSRPS